MKISPSSFNKTGRGQWLLTLLASLCLSFAFAQDPGDLQTAFADGGRLIFDVDDIDACEDLVWLDNRLVVAGHATSSDSLDHGDYLLILLREDGTVDSTAHMQGVIRGDFPGYTKSRITRAVVQGSRLLTLGAGSLSSDTQSIVVSRFYADGRIDSSFGNAGHASFEILGKRNDPGALDVTPSGKIVLCGTAYDSNFQHKELPFIGRLLPDGSPDTSFSPSGFMAWNPIDGFTDAWNFQLRPGRHSAGGGFYACAALSESSYAFAGVYNSADYWGFRLLADFSNSASFTTHYTLVTPALSGYHSDIVHRGEEVIGIGTPAGHFGPENFVIQTFGEYAEIQSTHEIDFNEQQDQSRAACLDPQNRLVVVGYTKEVTQNDPGFYSNSFAVAVLDHPWLRDFSFAENGMLALAFPGREAAGATAVIAHDQVIYAGGYVEGDNDSNLQDIGVAAIENPIRALGTEEAERNTVECLSATRTSESLIIQSDGDEAWTLFDLMGREVFSGKGSIEITSLSQWLILCPANNAECSCQAVPSGP